MDGTGVFTNISVLMVKDFIMWESYVFDLWIKNDKKEGKRTKIRYARDDYRTAGIVLYNQKETNNRISEWRNKSMTDIVKKELEQNIQ